MNRLAHVLLAALFVVSSPGAQGRERIVAAGAAATEILWDLGASEEVVGVDATSTHPPEALATKANVGYFRKLSAEGLLSLAPTLVIAVGAAGPREALDVVGGAGVKVVHLEDDWSERGVLDKVARIGAEIGRTAEAERLAARIRAEFAALAEARAARGTCPRVLFLLAFSNGRPLVGGGATAADAMIALAGGVNVATGFSGYKQMTDEAILSSAPDVVVTMANAPDAISVDELFAMPAFRDVPAAKGRRLVRMDGAGLLAFGPRTARMATDLMARIAGSAPAASRCSDANRATKTPVR